MRQVTHALLTRPPLSTVCASTDSTPFDLHVLSTPPAFILSQDQTLIKWFVCSGRPYKPLAYNSLPFTVGFVPRSLLVRSFVLKFFFLEFQGCHVVNFSRFCIHHRFLATAFIIYHITFTLSTTFFFFLRKFFAVFFPAVVTASDNILNIF